MEISQELILGTIGVLGAAIAVLWRKSVEAEERCLNSIMVIMDRICELEKMHRDDGK